MRKNKENRILNMKPFIFFDRKLRIGDMVIVETTGGKVTIKAYINYAIVAVVDDNGNPDSEYAHSLRKRSWYMTWLWLKSGIEWINNSTLKFFLTNPSKHSRYV